MKADFKAFLSSLIPKPSSSSGDLWSYWITHAESLRWILGLLMIVLIFETLLLFSTLRKPPVVIRVSEVGQAEVIRNLRSNNAADEVEIKAFAKDFLRSYIEISSVTAKEDLTRALNMMTKRFQNAHIRELKSTDFLERLIRANVFTEFSIKHLAVTSDSDSRVYIDVRGITSTRPLEDIGSPATRKGIIANLVLVRVPRTEQSPHGLLVSDFRREIRPLQEILGKEAVLPKEEE